MLLYLEEEVFLLHFGAATGHRPPPLQRSGCERTFNICGGLLAASPPLHCLQGGDFRGPITLGPCCAKFKKNSALFIIESQC